MSAFFPTRHGATDGEQEYPRLRQRPLTPAEERARWEVRAAQWRARELAQDVFGEVGDAALSGVRADGVMRGLMRLDVPFDDLALHRDREARFMAAVEADPLLGQVRLVYVFGADER